jgi:hypothetical protein
MKTHPWLRVLCLGAVATTASAQIIIENFEYEWDELLNEAWHPSGNAAVSLSTSVAPQSTGSQAMRVDFNFPSTVWATETIRGPQMNPLLSIGASQYVSFRLRGDPAFAGSDFRNLYLYAYDDAGNFGRWGGPVSVVDEWQVINYLANTIEQPWDSPAQPDLSRIASFAFYQYGSQAAIDAYTATIYIDDITARDTPLVEFPEPAAPRGLIDDFESYADDAALWAAYTYQNSPAQTITTASLESPAPQGNQALMLAIEFAPGQYPWGSVKSAMVAPFSFPSNAVATLRLKGDPALGAVADDGTTFWLSFYDRSGNSINYSTPADPVMASDWVMLTMPFSEFWSGAVVDTGNLVQWRILVEGWTGTPEQAGMSGTFYVDDVQIAMPAPEMTLLNQGETFLLVVANVTEGKEYELRETSDLESWTTNAAVVATSNTLEWPIVPDQSRRFYRVFER